jgi:hypothetical protein
MPIDVLGNVIGSSSFDAGSSPGTLNNIVTDGLICHLDPGNYASYPGMNSAGDTVYSTSTTIYDLSNYGSHATLYDWSWNSFNGYSWYNGTTANSGGIQLPLTNFRKLQGTFEIWAYPTSWNDSNGLFMNRDDSTANAVDWWWLGTWSSGGTLYFRLGDGSTCCNNDLTVGGWSSIHSVNTWGHYVVTWVSGAFSKIYFNGKLLTQKTISGIPSTNPSVNGRIGLGHGNGTSRWLGYLSATRFYARPLSSAEIYQNWFATKSRYGQ